jgi:hypothetical protein
MAFKGVFKFKSKEYRLLAFSHNIVRQLDARGAPATGPNAGTVSITIEVGDNNDIAEWAMLDYQTEEGEVVLFKRDSDATLRSLKFKDAYIYQYQELFSADDVNPCTFSFSITAKEVELSPGGIVESAAWA